LLLAHDTCMEPPGEKYLHILGSESLCHDDDLTSCEKRPWTVRRTDRTIPEAPTFNRFSID
jgi:hypothetical protein